MHRNDSTNTNSMNTEIMHTNQGNTELHDLLRQYPDTRVLEAWIRENGEEKASIMAKTVNDKGELPLDFVTEAKVSQQEKDALYTLMFPLTIPLSFKPLSEQIDIEKVKQEFQPLPNSQLETNLTIGVLGANYARRHVKLSTTHPQMNGSSLEEFIAAREEMRRLREKAKRKHYRIMTDENNRVYRYKTKNLPNNQTKKIKVSITDHGYNESILSQGIIVKNKQKGDCDELSHLANAYLLENYPKQPLVELFFHKGGDHVYIVIGRGSKSFRYQDWSKDAVICDPWAGEVYPAKQIPLKMRDFTRREIQYGDQKHILNLITFMNENIHKLTPRRSELQTKVTIELDDNDYFDNLIKRKWPHDFTAKEMHYFYGRVKPQLQDALDFDLIRVSDIEALQNPIPILYTIFNNEFGPIALSNSLINLNEAAHLPKELLAELMSENGIKYLTEIQFMRKELNEVNQEWLNAVMKFNRHHNQNLDASTLLQKRKRPVKDEDSEETPSSTKPGAKENNASGTFFKKQKTNENAGIITTLADQFVEFAQQYSVLPNNRDTKGMVNPMILIDWLLKERGEGRQIINDYQQWCELVDTLAKQGYNISSPLTPSDFSLSFRSTSANKL
jgi:hypothetical protein